VSLEIARELPEDLIRLIGCARRIRASEHGVL